ncbi:MAG TPA: lanthionine synthetase LanC family protein [Longimicrobium sp.]|jgi:lantibiotic modifying enzyme
MNTELAILTQAATRLAYSRLDEAERLEDDSPTWGAGYGRGFVPVRDSGLFNGRLGDALALAALYHSTGERAFGDSARSVVDSLAARKRAAPHAANLVDEIGLGLVGIGSLMYGLVQIGRWTQWPQAFEAAAALASEVTDSVIAADTQLELFWGVAGTIPGLLALHAEGAPGMKEAAVRCAEHLLSHRLVDPVSGRQTWSLARGEPECGFAHGSSGIAHALLQLHRVAPSAELYDAAIETFHFESTLFDEASANWRDLHGQGTDDLMCSWCHGATGVGLCRLSAVEMVSGEDDELVAQDLFRAISATLNLRHGIPDHLCCGLCGRIDFLLEAGERLGNPGLAARARALMGQRLEQVAQSGEFRIASYPNDGRHMQPGMWQGKSGIVYTLLRLTDPRKYPSVLTMAM